MNPDELDASRIYREDIAELTTQIERAIAISHAVANLDAGYKLYWASILYTRICNLSVSTLYLCPRSKVNPHGIHWDFAAVASLVRNTFELALTLYYLGFENVSEEEWEARLRVMQLHDCLSRYRMFGDFNSSQEQLTEFENQANELRGDLQKNIFFAGLPEKQQKKFLKGETPLMLIQDQILERMRTEDISQVRGYYRFLSAQTHSFPLSFYRMADRGDGRGEENHIETLYTAKAAQFSAHLMSQASDEMEKAFESFVSMKELKHYDLSYFLRKGVIQARLNRMKQIVIMPGVTPYLDDNCQLCGSGF